MTDGGITAPVVNLEDVLHEIWARVVAQVNTLLEAHESYGFVHFNAKLNPTLADILNAFSLIDFVLNQLVDSGKLTPEEAMSAINSRQCILKMKSLSLALSANDNEAYERIIKEMRFHAN